ncbi:basic proline-rich protein-like [Vulpes lagopus]|uniref:basic proline-rich protein-like n=1 Tax=Vulpes lagopus TaxID=494514 RepID=UPI001BCA562F|nr:basic proline-rich protein-like [Vulpes lagopus]
METIIGGDQRLRHPWDTDPKVEPTESEALFQVPASLLQAGEGKVQAQPSQLGDQVGGQDGAAEPGRRLQPPGGRPARAQGGREGGKDPLKLPHRSSEREPGGRAEKPGVASAQAATGTEAPRQPGWGALAVPEVNEAAQPGAPRHPAEHPRAWPPGPAGAAPPGGGLPAASLTRHGRPRPAPPPPLPRGLHGPSGAEPRSPPPRRPAARLPAWPEPEARPTPGPRLAGLSPRRPRDAALPTWPAGRRNHQSAGTSAAPAPGAPRAPRPPPPRAPEVRAAPSAAQPAGSRPPLPPPRAPLGAAGAGPAPGPRHGNAILPARAAHSRKPRRPTGRPPRRGRRGRREAGGRGRQSRGPREGFRLPALGF